MTALIPIVLGSIGLVLLWALVSPRSQWLVLMSWSYRDHRADEPSGSAYLVYRLVAALGIATMIASGFLSYQVHLDNQPVEPAPPTAVELMWGKPNPVVVNRVIESVAKAPKDLVDQPILGYQVLDGQTRQPPYLFGLAPFELDSATTQNGYVGSDPTPGLTALDDARLVIFVRGDPQCFPHAAIVKETAKTVSIAVYYGQANPKDGSNAQNVAQCDASESGANTPTLIPLQLSAPLKDRQVLTMSGDAIRNVPLP